MNALANAAAGASMWMYLVRVASSCSRFAIHCGTPLTLRSLTKLNGGTLRKRQAG